MAKEQGLDPAALRDRPVLTMYESYFKGIFFTLSDSRSYSDTGNPMPIPVSEIKSYCEMFYINRLEERTVLMRLVQEMDQTYCEVRNEQIKQRMQANKT